MNSKILVLFFMLILLGCGVKAKPLSPPEKAIQSYTDSYTGPSEKEKKTLPPTPTKK